MAVSTYTSVEVSQEIALYDITVNSDADTNNPVIVTWITGRPAVGVAFLVPLTTDFFAGLLATGVAGFLLTTFTALGCTITRPAKGAAWIAAPACRVVALSIVRHHRWDETV